MRSLWGELLLVLFFLIVSNNYLTKRDNLIEADGRGYYEFLPATFIYKDLQFKYLDTLQTEFYDDEIIARDFYPRLENGQRYDKYFIGTAVLQAPFFAVGHFWASNSSRYLADGFSTPYQISIYFAALFYTFLGLVFIRLLLKSYQVNRTWILVAQFGVIFCSSMLDYMHWDAAYSHVYSFFLIAGFLYFTRNYFLEDKSKSLFWAIVFIGMIILVRPVNGLILLFIPLLTENFSSLFLSLKKLFFSHFKTTIFSVILVALIFQIQCLIWFAQTGNWIHYAYGEETFNWTEPHFSDFLFSYRKGFFLWAPWFFTVFVVGIIGHLFLKLNQKLIYFLLAFSLLIYVLSSWWIWSYGGSIGSRVMIDFYPVFLVFLAPILASKVHGLKRIILLSAPIFTVIMIIQTYQFQKGILRIDHMDKESYWKVFLKTDPKYVFYLSKEEKYFKMCIQQRKWTNYKLMPKDTWYILDTLNVDLPNDTLVHGGQILFNSYTKDGGETLEIRVLDENDSLLFNHYTTLLHVIDEKNNKNLVDYRFYIDKILPKKIKCVFVILTKKETLTIDSMKIRFFTD
jgi:hypothetical protein